MMKLLLAAVGLVCLAGPCLTASSGNADGPLNQMHWQLYKRAFGKVYSEPEEEAMRRSLFLETRRSVEQHNAELADELGYEMGYSHLSDWTTDELHLMLGDTRERPIRSSHQQQQVAGELPPFAKNIMDADLADLPKEVDWRKLADRVGPVKDQGKCQSSWAFAATGLLEAQLVNLSIPGKFVSLSEQNLIDCDENSMKCTDGQTATALQCIADERGIESEQDYPYLEKDGPVDNKCSYKTNRTVVEGVMGPIELSGIEWVMQKFVARFGPVASTMSVAKSFLHYKSGIYNNPRCYPTGKHAVLVVGYGTDPKEGDYWIVKNSWGSQWGENGFFRIARNNFNMCGLANTPVILNY